MDSLLLACIKGGGAEVKLEVKWKNLYFGKTLLVIVERGFEVKYSEMAAFLPSFLSEVK